jgi:hypothetical protein
LRFLFDNCLSLRIARSVAALSGKSDRETCHLTDLFAPSTTDEEFIRILAGEGDWTVISGDINIIRSRHKRRALRELKATILCLSPGWMRLKLWDQGWRLIRRWPEIEQQAGLVEQAALFEVPVKPTAKFRQIFD